MKEINEKNFGIVIAFLLPGFIFLWGLTAVFKEFKNLFGSSDKSYMISLGTVLYISLASLACGLVISAFRWMIFDHLFSRLGIDGSKLKFENLSNKDVYIAFNGVIENHYRYYQYYSNTLTSILIIIAFYFYKTRAHPGAFISIIIILTCVALFWGAYDALNKYYERARSILDKEPKA